MESDVRFLIIGDGQLSNEIDQFLDERNLKEKVRHIHWLTHNEIPRHLNTLRLLVLPSYTEGLPNIILEAMACGTPVLATPVGVIPDIIKDNETGFIMEDNSPECIARNIIRVLSYPNIKEVTQNAWALVQKEFTYEKAAERYRQILSNLSSKGQRD